MDDSDPGYDDVDAARWTGGDESLAFYAPEPTLKTTSTGIPRKPYDDVSSGDLNYNMSHKRRGQALIICNQYFNGSLDRRAGSEQDSDRLTQTLCCQGFDVDKFQNLTTEEIQACLMARANCNHSDNDCFVCVILTHGSEDHVWGTDGRKVHLKTLISFFGGRRCPSLVGKPKIFIINACQGDSLDEGHDVGEDVADAVDVRGGGLSDDSSKTFQNVPYELDFLYVHSTVHGYYSYRNATYGSFFIKTLCDVIDEYADQLEICKLLTLVNRRMAIGFESRARSEEFNAKKQCSCFLSLLTRQLFLS